MPKSDYSRDAAPPGSPLPVGEGLGERSSGLGEGRGVRSSGRGVRSSGATSFLAGHSLHPAQAAFVATTERFSFYVGGIGAGKTYAGAVRAIAHALALPGSLGLVGAPTYPMLRDVTQRTFFELLPEGLTERYQKVEGHLTLTNGSEILFRSLDLPDRVRGLNLAWYWLDEAPLCGYYAWQVLKGRLRQEGYETAGWATGTPHGRDGFYRDFEARPRPHHALYRASTMENAAHLPESYIEDLGLSGPLYDQEVLGLFTAFAGLVYPFQADTNGHVRAPEEGRVFARVIGGIDWGYTNPTAAVVFGLDGDDRAWQLDEFYQRRAPLDAVVLPALVELTRRHGVRVWYAGPDEPEHIAALNAALREERLACRVVAADDSVSAGIQTVLRQLTRRGDGTFGLYVAPGCRNTIAEYGSYAYPEDLTPQAQMDLTPQPPLPRGEGEPEADLTPPPPLPQGEGEPEADLTPQPPLPQGEGEPEADLTPQPPLPQGEGEPERWRTGADGVATVPSPMGEGWRDSAGVRSDASAGVRSVPTPREDAGLRSELPIKANDHALDATRYALHTALRQDRGARTWMRAWLPDRREPDGA